MDTGIVAEALREQVAQRITRTTEQPHRPLAAPASAVPVCGFEEDPRIAAAISASRLAAVPDAPRWTAEQLVALAGHLASGTAMPDVAAALHVEPKVVKDMVCGFGTFAGKQFGPATDSAPLPPGFARTFKDQRNVGRSLRGLRAAARNAQITPEVAAAYLDRKYLQPQPLDAAPSIGTLWVYARLGRLEEVVSLVDGQAALAASLERAWSLVADAVDAAALALSLLAGWANEQEPPDLAAGRAAVAELGWAQPGLATRLANQFDVVGARRSGWDGLRENLGRLNTQCAAGTHHLVPTRLADFTPAQQRMLILKLAPEGTGAAA